MDWIARSLFVVAVTATDFVAAVGVVDAKTATGHSLAPRFRSHAVVVTEGLRSSFLAAQAHLGLEIYISTTEQYILNNLSSLPSISTSVNLMMCKILG